MWRVALNRADAKIGIGGARVGRTAAVTWLARVLRRVASVGRVATELLAGITVVSAGGRGMGYSADGRA